MAISSLPEFDLMKYWSWSEFVWIGSLAFFIASERGDSGAVTYDGSGLSYVDCDGE